MNEARISWTHPSGDGRSSTEDCHSLFRESVEESAACMRSFMDHASGKIGSDELAATIGEGCLGSCDRSGNPSSGNFTSPLPLGDHLLRWSEKLASGDYYGPEIRAEVD